MTPAAGDRPEVEIFVNPNGFDVVPEERVARAVRATLDDAGLRRGEISVTFLSDEDITAMNREYLERDRPTDVIAFSLGDPGEVLGDVYVGIGQAERNADEHSVTLEEELLRLAIHGTLHVLGHDHPEGEERAGSPMFELQERILGEVVSQG